ncbi:MAG: hypothetical protein ACREUG_08890 [Steroidobacteraceae bacterium]
MRALLSERIESYEELEILLALERARGTSKSADELSAALHVGSALIEPALRALEAHGLIARRDAPQLGAGYGYEPATPALDEAVRELARAYREQPIPVIRLMSENAIQRVRTGAVRAFADAFILRRDKNDGG